MPAHLAQAVLNQPRCRRRRQPALACFAELAAHELRDLIHRADDLVRGNTALDAGEVLAAKAKKEEKLPCGCPGSAARAIHREESPCDVRTPQQSQLRQWPVQIKLAPVNAPWFDGAKLLVAADCSAYAYGDFHNRFIKGHVTLIGCEILKHNDIRSITVVRMEVPCCGGIEQAVKKALLNIGKLIPWDVVIVSTDGRILDRV
ncbi:MAG: hypothetical protein BHW31_00510 [Firmicutes bacterium CAG:110_56_8]|nr:MAG: hypothetical protein BHW31_00510 [Firmicutes bacterium CAG:110_56_8]